MAEIFVDFSKEIGKIKPVHGVGQPPFQGVDFSWFAYLREANIPFSRLHDVEGYYGGGRYVDIPNLFRDFDADPANPDAYDFTFTDALITALVENGVEPFFRLGVTIENQATVKAYRIDPPKDYLKWAKICEGVIRHYTEGWADGFRYNIRYWEIWNEPDNYEEMEKNQCWRGSKEQFYEFYGVAASYLKGMFPHLKIGGYGSCGFYAIDGEYVSEGNSTPWREYFLEFFDGFINYVKAHNVPLDFFSWHSYASIERTMNHAAYARKRLDEAGYSHTECICNEWNCKPKLCGTARHAAITAGMLISMQNSPLDSAMFYDARIGTSLYGGLFRPGNGEPHLAYYVFKGFGRMYRLGTQVQVFCEQSDVYVAAASDGKTGFILISNVGVTTQLNLRLNGQRVTSCRIVDIAHCNLPCKLPERIADDTVLLIETEA